MPQLFIWGLSISKAPLQASTSSSWARSGKPSRTRNRSPFQRPRRNFTLPARHCELNGPNRVSLSPLSAAARAVKALNTRTRCCAWLLADVERDLIRTRTAEGRSRAQKRGQRMGRKPKLTEAQQAEARKRRRKVQRSPNSRAATVWERVRFPGSQPDLDFVKLIPTFHQFCNFFF